MAASRKHGLGFKANFISGLLTLIPLGITWLLLDFVFRRLSNLGQPMVRALQVEVRDDSPTIAKILAHPWFVDGLAALLVVVAIFLLGWLTNLVLGRRLVAAVEAMLARVPLVKSIYGSVKTLIGVLQTKPDSVERVVLIDFPHPAMKAIGLVTRTLIDQDTGRELAAVYVPTTPNPTNGYLELVPVESLISTDWTIDEAMNFIISGGAVSPDTVPFSRGAGAVGPARGAD
jgi:uncharacterized membrane protein